MKYAVGASLPAVYPKPFGYERNTTRTKLAGTLHDRGGYPRDFPRDLRLRLL